MRDFSVGATCADALATLVATEHARHGWCEAARAIRANPRGAVQPMKSIIHAADVAVRARVTCRSFFAQQERNVSSFLARARTIRTSSVLLSFLLVRIRLTPCAWLAADFVFLLLHRARSSALSNFLRA